MVTATRFPGVSRERGREEILTKPLPCNPGPHTVRFRYLISQANAAKLDVKTSQSSQSKSISFSEPEGLMTP